MTDFDDKVKKAIAKNAARQERKIPAANTPAQPEHPLWGLARWIVVLAVGTLLVASLLWAASHGALDSITPCEPASGTGC